MTAARAVNEARRAGVSVQMRGGALDLSGPAAVVDVWRPVLARRTREIGRLLAAAPATCACMSGGQR
jgi:hypothetical protein